MDKHAIVQSCELRVNDQTVSPEEFLRAMEQQPGPYFARISHDLETSNGRLALVIDTTDLSTEQ